MKIHIDNQQFDLKTVDFSQWKKEWNDFLWKLSILEFLEQFSNDSTFIHLQTSGSTGTPKQIKVKKEHLINSAKATCQFFKLSEKSTGLLCMNAKYIGAQMMLVRAMISGMNLVIAEPQANPVKYLNTNIDFAAMVPYQVENSLQSQQKFQLIKNLIIGGGKTTKPLQQKLQKTTVNCYETFGMTETYSHVALRKVAPTLEPDFTCLPNISVANNNKQQLAIMAPNLGLKQMLTNDIVKLSDNKHFTWIGRIDNVINSGGIKIYPEKLESGISFIPNPFVFIGLPHSELGEQLILVIEDNPHDTTELFEKLKHTLPKYHVPKQILFMNNFPRTTTNKIIRPKIRAHFMQKNHP